MYDLLKGIKIIDFTSVVLGPYATQILGDFGAEVVKIEPLNGDVFRYVRPGHSGDMGAGFINCNRNKKSIGVDLATEKGQALVGRLVAGADVVVHNMRPKSAAKLGIDFESLKAVNAQLVYCYASGFGQDGSSADEPAYDDTIQAVSGMAFLNANANGEPRFLPTIIADKVGGLHLAISILAGLASRNAKGEAVCIEAPMFESMVSFLLVEQLSGRSFVPPLGGTGYDRLRSPYRKPFRTSDGFISVIPYTTAHWKRFFELVGREEMANDERVTDPAIRSRSIDLLYSIIDEVTPGRSTQEWITLLRERDIPCANVNKLDDLMDNAHLREVGMFRRERHPTEGDMMSVRSPFNVRGEDYRPDLPAPGHGVHTQEILQAAGLGEEEIEELMDAGIINRHRQEEA